MKHSPSEDKALKRAASITSLPPEQFVAIARTPHAQRNVAQRKAMLEDKLKTAAEDFMKRENSNELYRYYREKGDMTNARYYAPSQLQDSTNALRRRLTETWKELTQFDQMPLAPYISRDSKRWAKTARFFEVQKVQRAIEKNGGRVRYRIRKTRADLVYARVIAPANRKPGEAKPEPQQLAFSL